MCRPPRTQTPFMGCCYVAQCQGATHPQSEQPWAGGLSPDSSVQELTPTCTGIYAPVQLQAFIDRIEGTVQNEAEKVYTLSAVGFVAE